MPADADELSTDAEGETSRGRAVIRLRNPSLEFNWLPNRVRKGMPTPRLLLLDTSWCGGAYWRKTEDRCVLESFGLDMDLKEGAVIALCGSKDPGTVAHEYRHHWQIESGYTFGESVWQEASAETYKASILRYFRSFWWEMDALKFQLKHAPDDISRLWWDWLMEAR
jgi:hypothetical protein